MEGRDGLGPADSSVPSDKDNPGRQDSTGRWVGPLVGAGAREPRFSAQKPGPDVPICAHTMTRICPAQATLQLGGLPRTCTPGSPGEHTPGPFWSSAPAAGRAWRQGGQNRPVLQERLSACRDISLQPTAWPPSSGARAHPCRALTEEGWGAPRRQGVSCPAAWGGWLGATTPCLGSWEQAPAAPLTQAGAECCLRRALAAAATPAPPHEPPQAWGRGKACACARAASPGSGRGGSWGGAGRQLPGRGQAWGTGGSASCSIQQTTKAHLSYLEQVRPPQPTSLGQTHFPPSLVSP